MNPELIFKGIILVLFLAILVSLASGMFFLIKDKGSTDRTAKSLTIRITLSIALFVLLIVGFMTGLIKPHGINPNVTQTEKALP